MRDYARVPAADRHGRARRAAAARRRARGPRRDLELVVQGAGARPPAARRRRCAPSRTRSSTSSPPTRPARRSSVSANACWRRRTACRRRPGAPAAPPGRRPGHFGKVFLADNGSTAVEIALKMALQAQAQRGAPRRTRFVALENALPRRDRGHAVDRRSRSLRGAVPRALLPGGAAHRAARTGAGPHDPAWLDAGAEWPAIEAALDAQADTLAAIVYEPVLQAAGGMLFFSPDLLRRLRALGRRARRLSDRRRDRRRDGAAGRDARQPPRRRAGPDLDRRAARLRGAVEGADRRACCRCRPC